MPSEKQKKKKKKKVKRFLGARNFLYIYFLNIPLPTQNMPVNYFIINENQSNIRECFSLFEGKFLQFDDD